MSVVKEGLKAKQYLYPMWVGGAMVVHLSMMMIHIPFH
jgi:hypothetical protein